jgi:hypothetical protein
MRLVQFLAANDQRRVGRVGHDGRQVAVLSRFGSVYELARSALQNGRRLAELAAATPSDGEEELPALLAANRVLAPLDHPDPAHCLVTGTGLTHIGSAQARDAMHQVQGKAEAELSDSMKMFRLGIEGGKRVGDRPAWRRNGSTRATAAAWSRRASRSRCRPSRSMAVRKPRSRCCT